jgi:hypothetical protein
MPDMTEARAAIAGLQGTMLGAQQVTIRASRQQPQKMWLSPALIKRLRVLWLKRSYTAAIETPRPLYGNQELTVKNRPFYSIIAAG